MISSLRLGFMVVVGGPVMVMVMVMMVSRFVFGFQGVEWGIMVAGI